MGAPGSKLSGSGRDAYSPVTISSISELLGRPGSEGPAPTIPMFRRSARRTRFTRGGGGSGGRRFREAAVTRARCAMTIEKLEWHNSHRVDHERRSVLDAPTLDQIRTFVTVIGRAHV